jgi:hypothetical protein
MVGAEVGDPTIPRRGPIEWAMAAHRRRRVSSPASRAIRKADPGASPRCAPALEKVLGEHIGLREGERSQRVSKLDALVRTTMNRALKGDPRFLRAVVGG